MKRKLSDSNEDIWELASTEPQPKTEKEALVTSDPVGVAVEPTSHSGFAANVKGEIDDTDLSLPYLSLVNNGSRNAETYDVGSYVVGGEVDLGTQVAPVLIAEVAKSYEESIDFGSEERPRRLDTVGEVKELGGTIEWGADGEKPSWSPILTLTLLVPVSNTEADWMTAHVGGKELVICRMVLRGSAYRAAAREWLTSVRLKAAGNPANAMWELGSRKMSGSGRTWLVPTIRHLKAVGEKIAAEVVSAV